MGRPTKYQDDYPRQARKLTSLGAIDRDLAEFFEVNEDTINEWKKVHPEFSESLKAGKSEADSIVEKSLFQRATGYSHEAVKIMQHEGSVIVEPYIERYPPDTTAGIFWLKNRRPEQWRDKQDIEHAGAVNLVAVIKDA